MPRPTCITRCSIVALLSMIVLVLTEVKAAPPPQSEGTRRMVELLARITERGDARANAYRNKERVKLMEADLGANPGVIPPQVLLSIAHELLNAGRTGDALSRLDQAEAIMRQAGLDPRSKPWCELRMRQAIAHLRRAEEDNCTLHHNARSCIFPIEGSGVHGERRGARAAASILSELVDLDAGNLRARWLLNIAYMTLGEYPDGVPAAALIPPELFQSEKEDFPRFPDVAATVGLDVDDQAGGVIAEDFDDDGDLDLMLSAMGLWSQLRYVSNRGDGTFREMTDAAGLAGLHGGLNLLHADYDNDGLPDVLVLRGAWMKSEGRYPNSLLRNRGDGTFEDVTAQAGLLSFHPTQTATWLDYDNDGWLDLFIGNESTPGDTHASELYRSNRDGTFTECAREVGVAVTEFVKGVASGDYDNDGRPDLYLSILGSSNILFHNDGPAAGSDAAPLMTRPWRFTDVARAAGVTEPLSSFPTWFWDYDNDGWEDLFVSGYRLESPGDVAADALGLPHEAELPRLYRNNHDGTFADVTRPMRLDRMLLAMGANFGDLDNDGWLDFYVGTGNPDLGMLLPNRMFRNAGGSAFQDVTTAGGFGHLQKGHGVAFADFDNDGDQDVYLVAGGAYEADRFRNALFENPGNDNRWLGLKLEGKRSNRSAIGARIKVVVRMADGRERAIHRTVRSGGSFGASPLGQSIGLGAATRIARVEIVWPAGGVPQILEGLALDRLYRVREERAGARAVSLAPVTLGKPDGP